ncbi:hypothetical protein O1R50_18060 [Glycomyces luteolus]|uniref:Uncharacterized protein n=1 Tax=Glycomyces luteolus TaxID=2670330 RepID=A0A9X3PDH8_9ACTN|nr:hypothetical protein [Glycomyces luteolus]MDA1361538.1 hypothetical protein [Glycomyces luteolus]
MTYDPRLAPSSPAPPDRKPAAVGVIQVAVFLIAIATPALYFMLMQRLVGLMADREMWDLNEPGDTPESLATGEFLYALVTVIGLPILLAVLAILSAIGLHKRRRWARVLTAVWVGIMLLPLAAWGTGAVILWKTVPTPTGTKQYFLGPIDPIMLNAIAGPIAFLAALIVFILIFTRRVRQWAPKQTAVPGPPQPPTFNSPQGFAPQPGYAPQAGYGPPQPQPNQQTSWPSGPTGPRS